MRLNNGVVGQMTGIAEKEEGAWDETLAVADCVREQVAARWQNFRKLAIPPSMLAARQPGPRKTSPGGASKEIAGAEAHPAGKRDAHSSCGDGRGRAGKGIEGCSEGCQEGGEDAEGSGVLGRDCEPRAKTRQAAQTAKGQFRG